MTVPVPGPAPRHGVVRASAGSGKTYQLVGHYLRRLHAGADPAAVLAVTFTRKAAGEILANLVERLVDAVRDDGKRRALGDVLGAPDLSVAEGHALLARLVDALPRLSVGTVDSFFHRVGGVFRHELDLPVDPRMADVLAPEVVAFRQDVIADVLADGAGGDLTGLFRRLHGDRAARPVALAFDTLVLKLHDVWRLAPARDLWDRLEVPVPLPGVSLERAIGDLASMRPLLPVTAGGAPHKTWEKAFVAAVAWAQGRQWEGFLGSGIAARVLDGGEEFAKKPITGAWRDAFTPLIDHASAVVLERLRQRHLAAFDLLARFDAVWGRQRRRRNLLLFSDLTHALACDLPALLRGRLARLRHRLDASVDHLLLDEFQDTSPSQWQVLQPLADDVTEGAERDHSLFVVGDVKQAIYGWRGGNAALFAHVERRYELPAQDLATSYRSAPVVMDLVNAVFDEIGTNAGLGEDPADREAGRRFQAGFVEHRCAGPLAQRPGHVLLRSSAAPPGDEEDGPPHEELEEWPEAPVAALHTEADDVEAPTSHEEYVARHVAALHAAHPGGSVAVLVRTNLMAARLLHELRRTDGGRQALPVSGEGGAPLTGSPAVAAILSAFALADHPADSASAHHVATSPLGPLLGLAPGAAQPEAAATARRLRRDLHAVGMPALLGRWVARLAPACDAGQLDSLLQLLDLAHRYEPTARPGDFVRFVAATPVERAGAAPIRVMTIHAAKGLEFDTVVLPELDNRPQYAYPVLVPRDDEAGPPTAVLPFARKELRQLSAQLQGAYEQERSRRRYEDLCILYVALTRARHAVHMIVRPKPKRRDHRLFADLVRFALAPGVELTEEGDQVLYEAGEARWFDRLPPRPLLSGSAAPDGPLRLSLADPPPGTARRAWPATRPSALEGEGRVTGAELLAVDGGDARIRGHVVHDWLQRVGFVDEPNGVPADEALLALARRRAPALADDTLDEWLRGFHEALEGPALLGLLQRQGARDLWLERAFALRDDGRLLQGRFDRVALWADRALLVDFKTDAGGAATRQRYGPQLEAYRAALGTLLSLPAEAVEARLAFVTTGEVC